MDNPKMFLLKRIVGYKTNDYPTFGELNAKHIDDIAKLMLEFSKEAIDEITVRINKGETVIFDNRCLSLKKSRR